MRSAGCRRYRGRRRADRCGLVDALELGENSIRRGCRRRRRVPRLGGRADHPQAVDASGCPRPWAMPTRCQPSAAARPGSTRCRPAPAAARRQGDRVVSAADELARRLGADAAAAGVSPLGLPLELLKASECMLKTNIRGQHQVVTPGPAGGAQACRLVAFALASSWLSVRFRSAVSLPARLDGDVVGVAATLIAAGARTDRVTFVDGEACAGPLASEHQAPMALALLPRSPSWPAAAGRRRWRKRKGGGLGKLPVEAGDSLRPALTRPWPRRAITPRGPAWPAPRPWARPAMVTRPGRRKPRRRMDAELVLNSRSRAADALDARLDLP